MKKYLFIAASTALIIFCQSPDNNQDNQIDSSQKLKEEVVLKDYGANPLVVNIEDYTLENEDFRTAIWTGDYFQLTVMSIPVGGEVGVGSSQRY